MRLTVAMAVACVIGGVSFADPAKAAIKKLTNIPAQNLGSALRTLANDRDVQMVYFSDAVDALDTAGAVGELTTEEALTRVLVDTGLTYRYLDSATITVLPIAATTSGGGVTRAQAATQGTPAGAQTHGTEATDAKEAQKKSFWDRFRVAQVDQGTAAGDRPVASSDPTADATEMHKVTLEEVVVTAQKREERLIDVPISITAVSGETLNSAGITNMQNLSYVVPSMSTAEVGPGRQVITLRGLGGYRGNTSLTGVYLDEVPISGLQDGFVATYADLNATDLERVEVLKGPQGTLFGEGSVGGTVRFITKDPDLTGVSGKVETSLYDSARGGESYDASAVLNLPLVADKFGLRVEASYENDAGWIDRVAAPGGPTIDEDINDSELLNVRVKGLWAPTEELAVKGLVVVHRGEGGGSNIVNVEPREDSKFVIEFDPTGTMRTGFTDDYDIYNLTATYDFKSAQLLSSTSYSTSDSNASFMQRKPLIPAPNPGFQELLIPEYVQETSSFSQEIRLSSAGSSALKWTLGAFYRDADLIRRYPVGFDFWRFGQRVGSGRLSIGLYDKNDSESWATFGDISYEITSRFTLGGGVRYFQEDRTVSGLAQSAPTVIPAATLTESFDHTTYRTYLSYAVTDGIRIYGSAATGFRSGGFNPPNVPANGGPATFEPETVISYELGMKTSLADGRLSLQTALFYSDYSDIQMSSVFTAANGTPISFTGNPGKARIKGFEAELNWAATQRLTLGLSGDVTDTELTQVDPRVLVGGQQQFQVGDPIDLVPDYSATASVDYAVDWSPSVPGYLRLQYSQQGKNTTVLRTLGALEPITHTPVLDFLSASIGADWNGWQFELFGRNLLDETGALRTGGGVDPQARPRTIGVKFQRTF